MSTIEEWKACFNRQPDENELLQIAVAESIGWSRISWGLNSGANGKNLWYVGSSLQGTPPEDKDKSEDEQRYEVVPNYSTDLNAMQKVVLDMTHSERRQYARQLRLLVINEHDAAKTTDVSCVLKSTDSTWLTEELVILATCQQRAKAYLQFK